MSVNINKGAWQDFATGDKGGDLVSLFAAKEGLEQGEAFKALASEYQFEQNGSSAGTALAVAEPVSDVIKPPKDTDVSKPLELFKHRDHGKPSSVWFYKDTDGELLFCIARYDTKSGKQILPWTWSKRGF